MKREHFNYIVDRFNLTTYCMTNHWFPYLYDVVTTNMIIKPYGTNYQIACNNGLAVFTNLPLVLSHEVLAHTKDTEMLFI